jgi:hypothetical protein
VSQVGLDRGLRRRGGALVNRVGLRCRIDLLLVIMGRPHRRVERGGLVYEWPERGLALRWRGFGFFDVEGGEEHLDWLLGLLVDRVQRYNETVKFALYGCKNDAEWAIVRELVGPDRLLDYVTSLRFVNRDGRRRTVNQWQF